MGPGELALTDFPIFRRPKFPMVGPSVKQRQREERFRGSARERGYDTKWDKTRAAFVVKHPFCRFCEQEGRTVPLEEVDHIIPITDGGRRYDWRNLQGICISHHNGMKRVLQEYARANKMTDQLPLWCSDPTSRPRIRGVTHGPARSID